VSRIESSFGKLVLLTRPSSTTTASPGKASVKRSAKYCGSIGDVTAARIASTRKASRWVDQLLFFNSASRGCSRGRSFSNGRRAFNVSLTLACTARSVR
jgi:hypothetical protein